jgi:uncharacterized integral membrane protein
MSAQSDIGEAADTPSSVGEPAEAALTPRVDPVHSGRDEQQNGEAASGPTVAPVDRLDRDRPGRTRLSASWTAVVAAAILLIALVIFIGQNTQQSTINFLGVHGKAPTAVVLLVAALAGAVIVMAVGIARILQLRKTAKQARNET